MKILLKISLLVLFITTISCGVFDPRDSQEPENPVPWVSYPIHKEQVLENVIYSYNYPENIFKYNELFTDDYIFHFSSIDVSEHGTLETLDLDQESEMLVNLQKNFSLIGNHVYLDSLVSIENQEDVINNDTATLYRRYYLRVEGSSSMIYQGKAEFYLVQNPETSLWRIKEWTDVRTVSNQTWGLLKNEYTL